MNVMLATEAEGYNYDGKSIVTLFFRPAIDTDEDRLAFGFMTWNPNGTFTRLDSDGAADFLEAKLVTKPFNFVNEMTSYGRIHWSSTFQSVIFVYLRSMVM